VILYGMLPHKHMQAIPGGRIARVKIFRDAVNLTDFGNLGVCCKSAHE